jgi:putative oxygen-independent coproporphyrinogen III oxidase
VLPPADGDAPPAGLYVHVPFCVSLCPYCDFVVAAGATARGPRNRVATFAAAVRAELGLRADLLDARFGRPATTTRSGRAPLRTVYVGGGTPTLLPVDELAALLEVVESRYGLAPDAELTIEANPGPDERGDPVALRALGFGRLSFGAQSLRPSELRRLGRRHQPADVGGAVAAARAAGIRSINLDLLYDVPGQTLPSWIETLETALELGPDHLSLYALTLDDPDAEGLTGPLGDHLPTSAGARRWRSDARAGQDDDRAIAQYHYAAHRLAEEGWRGYEISNWAIPGHESRHNLGYWERLPYEAVGPGAHAFDGASRRWNAARLDAYLAALAPDDGSPRLPPGGVEALDPDVVAVEELILGLRMDRGVGSGALAQARFAPALAWGVGNELLEVGVDERIRLTTRGRLLSNEVFARLV